MTELAEVRRVPVNEADQEIDGGAALAQRPQRQAMVEVASTRAAQSVQAAMVVAKKFPRDDTEARGRILRACARKVLAEQSQYAYPRGGQTVTGPSIRLAEVLAQNWGNIDSGIIEVEQRPGESTMEAYCWDLETNKRSTRIFVVKHERHTRNGVTKLTDPRDIYELTANQGARRLRACILETIPGDIVEEAVAECDKTLQGDQKEPLADRITKMAVYFHKDFGIDKATLEKRLGHRLEVTTESELAQLRKIAVSLRDNMANVAQFFDVGGQAKTEGQEKAAAMSEKLAGASNDSNEPNAADEIEKLREKAKANEAPAAVQLNKPAQKQWEIITKTASDATGLTGDELVNLVTTALNGAGYEKSDLNDAGKRVKIAGAMPESTDGWKDLQESM